MDDNLIIDLFWNREEIAIRHTARKYGNYLCKIAFNILHVNKEVEECVNDTYFAAWNQIPPKRPKKLLPFLGRITRNISLNRYDYLTAKKRNGTFDILLSELEDCLSSSANVEKTYENGEISRIISDFLMSCDSDTRNVFVRRYWFSDSISDISKMFNMSESKIKSMLFRTRIKLKGHLEKEGYQ